MCYNTIDSSNTFTKERTLQSCNICNTNANKAEYNLYFASFKNFLKFTTVKFIRMQEYKSTGANVVAYQANPLSASTGTPYGHQFMSQLPHY